MENEQGPLADFFLHLIGHHWVISPCLSQSLRNSGINLGGADFGGSHLPLRHLAVTPEQNYGSVRKEEKKNGCLVGNRGAHSNKASTIQCDADDR